MVFIPFIWPPNRTGARIGDRRVTSHPYHERGLEVARDEEEPQEMGLPSLPVIDKISLRNEIPSCYTPEMQGGIFAIQHRTKPLLWTKQICTNFIESSTGRKSFSRMGSDKNSCWESRAKRIPGMLPSHSRLLLREQSACRAAHRLLCALGICSGLRRGGMRRKALENDEPCCL